MKTVGLSIITKNEETSLPNLLEGVKGHFDEIVIVDTGSTDKTVEIAKAAGCTVVEVGDKFIEKIPTKILRKMRGYDEDVPGEYSIFRFDKARNYAFSLVKTDYIVWLDADDTIDLTKLLNGRTLKDYVHKDLDHGLDAVYWAYDYDQNKDTGESIAWHWRERLLKNNPCNFSWIGMVHETLIPNEGFVPVLTQDPGAVVTHKKVSSEHMEASLWRNHLILLFQFARDGEQTDPRILSYLGGSFAWRKKPQLAIEFLLKHIERTGWPEDAYRSWNKIAEAYGMLKRWDRMEFAYQQALTCTGDGFSGTTWPDAWIGLAAVHTEKENWQMVLDYCEIALKKGHPDTLSIVDPSIYVQKPLAMVALAYMQMGKIKEAHLALKKLAQINPKHDKVQAWLPMVEAEFNLSSFIEHIGGLLEYLVRFHPNSIEKFFKSLPKDIALDNRVMSLKAAYIKPRDWPEKSIVFICGGLEPWSPRNVEQGIGGSEEAVIYLTRELSKLGRDVTVYNTIEEAEEFDGVKYVPISEFNPKDNFDVVVSWRMPKILDQINAKKKYVDMHDVPTSDFPDVIDKIFVKSEYHKSILPKEVQDKAVVISNGINPEDFGEAVPRNPKRVIYASSPDRGLECLLNMWPKVKEQVPDAELVWYYGWDNFDAFHSSNPEQMKWKWQIKKKMFDVGAIEGGRVGHKELAKEMLASGVWAYPTEFTEINCITALKAQEAGCIPVTTHCYALEETVKEPELVVTDIYTNEKAQRAFISGLIATTNTQDRPKYDMSEYYWENIAKEWDKEL